MFAHVQRIQRRFGALRRRTAAAIFAGMAVLCLVVATIGWGIAAARDDDLTGRPVADDQLSTIMYASRACPMLTPARLAGQLMAESGLDPSATRTTSGGQGIAGLDDKDWRDWAPWPDARRDDAAANIVALARQMCQLSGKLRAAEVPGDPWWLALAAFHTELGEVERSNGVPDGAITYVGSASGYAAYYGKLPQFGGAGDGQPPPGPARQPKAVPAELVALIVQAGSICPQVTPAAVAGQLMASSGFDANLLGPGDRQGIAQFQSEVWQRYGPAEATPWEPTAAVPALGAAMCGLIEESGAAAGEDPYLLALAAYHLGPTALREADGAIDDETRTLLTAVGRFTEFYGADARLAVEPTGSPTPSVSPTPSGSPTPGATPSPAVPSSPPAAAPVNPPANPPADPPANPPAATTSAPKPTPPPAPVRPANARQLVGKETGLCVSAGTTGDGARLTLQRCTEDKTQWWEVRGDGTIRANGLCMDVAWGASADGTPVQVAYCSGNPAQGWRLNNGMIVSTSTNKCLDVDGHGVGAPLNIWYCVANPKQTWSLR
ncbi:ricin-type beta-trefoil lectin domain protein [Solwaraspora sp. WMMD406]|uniref:ricin-type beta-trefoil lectin domain protein n=1 Tax=Solwaraspora sp. WMMD406 TaxID=3016095 RepID=UPI00241758B9|nr:ricin-type beta-trefoil lectin domain protein [Solwaraspora sp. WMMD406]MDG4763220.1 ricin-type beta-trefoil lectin domain protein [Solwaraspora sp. WMMD406]